jgi:ABC-2 type transport system ATP-binding protein
MAAIEVSDLTKTYGDVRALQGVTIRVGTGEIYGLLGRNGAGKSTLVKILLSIVRKTGGSARLLDRDVPHAASRRQVGYLPEDHRFPEYHTGVSALDFYGALSEMPRADRRRRIPELLERMGLADARDRKIRGYSKGMKQRLGLAQAILHDPDVILLDEPTDGVDVVGRMQIRDLLLELKSRGKTIFLNSHLLSEVERLCDRVGILEGGKLVREGTVAELTKTQNLYAIKTEGPVDAALEALRKLAPDVRRTAEGVELSLPDPKNLDRAIDLLRSAGVGVRGVTEKRFSLEEVFREAIQ